MLQQPDEALVVAPIPFKDPAALLGSRFGPAPVLLGEIARLGRNAGIGMRVVAVHLELPVRHLVELDHLTEARDFSLGDLRQHMHVVLALIAGRFLDRDRVRLVLGEVKTKAEGLDAGVRFSGGSGQEVVVLEADVDMTGMRFVEVRPSFAPHAIRNSGERGEVAFVGAVDEGLRPKIGGRARVTQILGGNRDELHGGAELLWPRSVEARARRRLSLDAVRADDPRRDDTMPLEQGDVLFRREHVTERFFRDVGLEAVAVLAHFHLLRIGSESRGVVLDHPALELVVESAHGTMLADVGVRQSTRDDAADMGLFFEHDDLCATFRRRHGCGDSGWIGRDHNDIRLLRREHGGESEKESEQGLHASESGS